MVGPVSTHYHYCYPVINSHLLLSQISQFTNNLASVNTSFSTTCNISISSSSIRRRRYISFSHTKNHKNPSLKTEDNKSSLLFSPNKDPGNKTLEEEQQGNKISHRKVSLTNMGWSNFKAALGQRLNFEGITSAISVVVKDSHLAIPHLTVQDIRWIDWAEMKKKGFEGVVFDKDNTLTVPYSLSLWSPLSSSLDKCRSVFGDNVVVFSNSAGLRQYDADGSKARAVEESIGVHVLRHSVKKPGGEAEEIEKYFGCGTSQLIMVGDRLFTDIVYGNRNGFLTILTKPLSLAEEPFVVKQVRKFESYLVSRWYQRGLKPKSHNLLSEAKQCVKSPLPDL